MGSDPTSTPPPVTKRTWLQRLVAFPATYGKNVEEALKIAAAIGGGPSIWTVRYYAFRIAMLTLRRRINSHEKWQLESERRRTAELAQIQTIAGEIDKPGTFGLVIAGSGHELEYLIGALFDAVHSPLRLYLRASAQAEFTNGSTLVFRHQDNRYSARGYRIDWAWVAPGVSVTLREEWIDELRATTRFSRSDSRVPARLYVDGRILSHTDVEPHRRG